MSSYELPEVLVAVIEEVLYPKRSLWQIQERFSDFITDIHMISGFIRNIQQFNLIRHGIVPTVAVTQGWRTHLERQSAFLDMFQ